MRTRSKHEGSAPSGEFSNFAAAVQLIMIFFCFLFLLTDTIKITSFKPCRRWEKIPVSKPKVASVFQKGVDHHIFLKQYWPCFKRVI